MRNDIKGQITRKIIQLKDYLKVRSIRFFPDEIDYRNIQQTNK